MNLKSKLFTVFFLCAGVCMLPAVYAAEIININYKYKIAFTDMNDRDVKVGSNVIVTLSDGKKLKLKVLETFPVMAKLTVPDGNETLTDQEFAAITVGNPVGAADEGGDAGKGRLASRPARVVSHPEALGKADMPAHIETYSPGVEGVVAAADEPGEGVSSARARAAVLERRLDEMMANNVKLVDNITQLLTEKNAAEALARNKEADSLAARKKANDLADANEAQNAKIAALTASIEGLQQEKALQRKEIESLNLKLGELKKKLARMVEIVNTNMKAYEK